MEFKTDLPEVNKFGYYEIRMESIGGLGANLSGKLLGQAGGMYMGLNSAAFSSYGSEKRGSPVKSFVRWAASDKDIRLNSPVENPHLLGLFSSKLLDRGDVLAGVTPESKVVVNAPEGQCDVDVKCKLYTVDAQKIAHECKSRVNMVMLGAMTKASGFIPLEAVIEVVKNSLGKKYPMVLEGNINALKRGFDETAEKTSGDKTAPECRGILNWGWKNAPIGGVNIIPGNTVSNDLSGSREGYVPIFIKERCINCGLCDTTCPDMVFQFVEGEFKGRKAMVNAGLDYRHCKGCLRCVQVCPVEALVQGDEREYNVKEHQMDNIDLIKHDLNYINTGANSWVTEDADRLSGVMKGEGAND